MDLAYKYRNSNKLDEDRGGMWRGTNFVPNAQLQEERSNKQAMDLQGLKNKGLLDPVKYRQNAETGRAGQQLGFDKEKQQQNFGLRQQEFGQRKLEQGRRFGLDTQKSDDAFWQNQNTFKQNKLNQDRSYDQSIFETKYKNEAEKKKAWDSAIDRMVNVQIDEDGAAIPGTGGYSYKEAADLMRNRERFYKENQVNNAAVKTGRRGAPVMADNVTESQSDDGTQAYSNVETAGQGDVEYVDQPGGLPNYEDPQVPQNNALREFNRVANPKMANRVSRPFSGQQRSQGTLRGWGDDKPQSVEDIVKRILPKIRGYNN